MPKKLRTVPRNKPRQARAQATVQAILDGTIRILEREGNDAATTTRIAEIAGVSIGTLYQYFADRGAIIDALQEREFERTIALVEKVLSNENLTRSPRTTIEAIVRGLVELYVAAPALHRVLAIEMLRTKKDRVHAFDLQVIAVVRHFLSATNAPVRRTNADAAAFVAFQSVRATMLASLLERPAGLDMDTLTDEMVDLVMRYLVHDDKPAQKPAKSKTRRKVA